MAVARARLRQDTTGTALVLLILALLLTGCAGLVFGASGPSEASYTGPGPSRLRIAIYEPLTPFLVPHAALIIHAPDGHIIYDPAGWTPDPRGQRRADVTYAATPEIEQAFILRDAMPMLRNTPHAMPGPEAWELFLFEIELSDEIALEAARLARQRPAMPMASCTFGVSTLLRQLPGFEQVAPCWLPQTLRRQLQMRDDLTLTRHRVPQPRGG